MGVKSLSLEPDASAVTCNGTVPEGGVTVSAADGGESPVAPTWTVAVALDESPAVSVTVTVTVYVPGRRYVCWAVAPACGPTVVPSPKSNRYVAIGVESVSLE